MQEKDNCEMNSPGSFLKADGPTFGGRDNDIHFLRQAQVADIVEFS
jgi:hypothetical protein